MSPDERERPPVRVMSLSKASCDPDYRRLTPSERVEMVWELTLQAWRLWKGLGEDEPRLRRNAVRVARLGG